MNRWENLKKLLRMDGSVGERIGTGVLIVGGFIVGRLEHMPKKGEKVKQGRFRFEVLRADGRRVHLLKLKIKDN